MKQSWILVIAVGVGLLAVVPRSAPAALLCVEPTGAGGCSMTVQGAIDAASSGDTIEIAPAVYNEAVNIPAGTDNLLIEGDGATLYGAGLIVDGLTVLANGTTVKGLGVHFFEANGIVVGDDVAILPAGTTLQGVSVVGSGGACISLRGADSTLITGAKLTSCNLVGLEALLGPDVNGADDLTVQKSSTLYAGSGCMVVQGDNARIISNKATNCVNGPAIEVSGNAALVEGNKVSNINGAGIFVLGDAAVVQKNKVVGSSNTAIGVVGDTFTVLKNKVSFGSGIRVVADPCNVGGSVVGNKVSDTQEDETGIDVSCDNGTGSTLVEKNTAVRVMDYCFDISGANFTVNANKATHCGGDAYEGGFDIGASDSTVTGNLAKGGSETGFLISGDNTTVSGNKSIGNYGPGFQIGEDNTGVVLSGNSSSRNVGPGFAVYSDNTAVTLTANSSSDAVPYCKDDPASTVIDGMGNSFSLAAPPVCPIDR